MLVRPLVCKQCLTVLLLCLFSFKTTIITAAPPRGKDSLINISFGKNNVIRYHLNTGTWDVLFSGKQMITGAYAAYKGKKEMRTNNAGAGKYSVAQANKGHKGSTVHSMEFRQDDMRMVQTFIIHPGKDYFITRFTVQGNDVAASYISPLTTSNVSMDDKGDSRALYVPFDNDMWARFNAHPLARASFTSSEVTALYNNDTYRGLVIGSVEQDVWKTGINVKANDSHTVSLTAFGGFADSNITHDKIPHGLAGEDGGRLCSSPYIMVGMFSDWRSGMEAYAAYNREWKDKEIAHWKKATPVGWNSWGVLQTKLNLANAKGVIDFFSDSCKGFRNADGDLYIDLDSFWDNMIKGGLDGDVSDLKAFVQYCKSKHLKPGIYWAPFTDWGKHDRKMEGSNYTYAQAWLRQKGKAVELDGAYAMDPTHPGTKARIAWTLTHLKKLGFEMIKIDFLGHAALESDRFADAAVTTGMQAYKAGLKYVDSVLDNTMLVYAAISPTMATAPYVHMRRIACDAFSAIDNTEYTLNSTGYGWWQSHLYDYVDADHVVFNREKEGAMRARLASALVTGTLITGDDYSQAGPWSQAAQRWLQNKALLNVVKDGRSFRPIEANTGDRGVELFEKTVGNKKYLAIFNFTNNPRKYTLPLTRLGFNKGKRIKMKELFTGANHLAADNLQVELPASDVMLYEITISSK